MKRSICLMLCLLAFAACTDSRPESEAQRAETEVDPKPAEASPTKRQAQPEGPFAHTCAPENSEVRGDFDGDGTEETARFEAFLDKTGRAGWMVIVRDRDATNEGSRSRVDAECPEAIGATDVDQDGDDELFFDTGRGMTAALVDLLVFAKDRLREVTHRPKGSFMYVGSSMAGRSDLRCVLTEGTPLIEIVTVDVPGKRVTAMEFSLSDRTLVRTGTFPIRGDARGRLRCFGLRWRGY